MTSIKNLLSILLFANILYGCSGSIKGLPSELYYSENIGHNGNIKMIAGDKYNATIIIPIKYSENIENYPKNLPSKTLDALKYFNESPHLYCENCTLTKQNLIISLHYDEQNKNDISGNYCKNCNHITYEEKITFLSDDKLNSDELGINTYLSIIPNEINVSCDQRTCKVLDPVGNFVNDISIQKNMSFNHKKLEKIIKEEKNYQANIHKRQEKECPKYYHVLLDFESFFARHDSDTVIWARINFWELKCSDWVKRKKLPLPYLR